MSIAATTGSAAWDAALGYYFEPLSTLAGRCSTSRGLPHAVHFVVAAWRGDGV